MMKIRSDRGFTLMELLIVIAIIVVLVAISIPIFSKQLEKAREATDIANMRDAKAAAVTAYLSEEMSAGDENSALYYDAGKGVLTEQKPSAYGQGTKADGGVTYVANSECPKCAYKSSNYDYRDAVLLTYIDEGGEAHIHWDGAKAVITD